MSGSPPTQSDAVPPLVAARSRGARAPCLCSSGELQQHDEAEVQVGTARPQASRTLPPLVASTRFGTIRRIAPTGRLLSY